MRCWASSDRERRVLRLRFGLTGGEPQTLQEIGDEFQVTRERIRQIERNALQNLRVWSDLGELHELLV